MLPWLVGITLAAPATSNADRVLVIANVNSSSSLSIAELYMQKRGVKNLLKVSCKDSASSANDESIAFSDFQQQILEPVKAALKKLPKVDFIVTTKGVPIRILNADTGIGDGRASLDSYLATIGYEGIKDAQRIVINEGNWKGKCWSNRFWNSQERFSHAKHRGYLVTRLDAYTTDQAKTLIGLSITSEAQKPEGSILIDATGGHSAEHLKAHPLPPSQPLKEGGWTMADVGYPHWDADLELAAEGLSKRGFTVSFDKEPPFVGKKSGLMGYASWGSNDGKFDAEGYKLLRFNPGAIAETAVSTSARTFLPTTGGQSLIADLILGRVTGVKGYCDEPFLSAVASPSVLFDRYTRGWTLAESFYAASRYVGWEDIVIGDPLCSPYRTK